MQMKLDFFSLFHWSLFLVQVIILGKVLVLGSAVVENGCEQSLANTCSTADGVPN